MWNKTVKGDDNSSEKKQQCNVGVLVWSREGRQ